ncbi:MAG: sigma-70 family RNA polymerase sigma factor [Fimbriimonadia bacterium]|nr:sigma-70 family RNA polymerase sigma factor [Fimbriimonadia bacterium]
MTWEWQTDSIRIERVGAVEAAERTFFQSLRDQVKRMVRRYIRTSDDDVEDLTQECMIRIYNNLDRLKGSEAFEPWLKTVVRNASLTWLRDKQRERDSYVKQIDLHQLEDGLDYEIEEHLAIQQALNEMEDIDQKILELRYCEGMKYSDIGEQLNMSEESVRKRVNRATTKLRQHPIIRAIIQEAD